MRRLLILITAIVVCSCGSRDDNGKKSKFGMNLMVCNGCQYVVFVESNHGATAMVHAANCNNPTHLTTK